MKRRQLLVSGIMVVLVITVGALLVYRHHTPGAPIPEVAKSTACLASTSAKPTSTDDSAIQIVVVGQPISARIPAGSQANVYYNTYSSKQATGSVHYVGNRAYNFVVNQTGKAQITDSQGNDLSHGWQLVSITACK